MFCWLTETAKQLVKNVAKSHESRFAFVGDLINVIKCNTFDDIARGKSFLAIIQLETRSQTSPFDVQDFQVRC